MTKKLIILVSLISITLLVGCSSFTESSSVNISKEDDIAAVYLHDKFNEYVQIDEYMLKSEGTGHDVYVYYENVQALLSEISTKEVPTFLAPIKKKLIDGIRMHSDGAACMSNNKICGSDIEAVKLRFEGNDLLDEFKDDLAVYYFR